MTASISSRHKGFATKRFGVWILAFIMAGIGYLAFWPVAIDPIIWDPPTNRAYEGVYRPNTALASLEPIALNGYQGPEDAVLWQDHIFTAVSSGDILKINPKTLQITPFANTDGRPLGLEVNPVNNHLIIADAYKGLMSLSPDGALTLLSDSADGRTILYADDVDIAPDGVIYFSDASTKFGAQDNGGTLAASLLELMERRATGRLLAYVISNMNG